jgi:hypothetical protein
MRLIIRHTLLTILVVVIAATALSVAACGGSGAKVDPATVLAGSAAAMKQLQGFHFVYEVHKPANTKPPAGTDIARITGDVSAQGDMKAVLDVTQNGVPLKLNFVQVGDTQYLQIGIWQKIPVDQSPVGRLNLGAGTVAILQQIAAAQDAGRQKKGGADCYHITGDVPAAAVKAIATLVETTTPFPADVWLGVKDGYVYEVDIHGPATADEPKDTWRSIVVSQHNVPVVIKAPI